MKRLWMISEWTFWANGNIKTQTTFNADGHTYTDVYDENGTWISGE